MSDLQSDFSGLKDMLEKRETYIRFSPLGTVLVGIMYILSYFVSSTSVSNELLFHLIATISVVGVTLLSLYESKRKSEVLLPKSIRFIIGNLLYIAIVYGLVSYVLTINGLSEYIIPLAFVFYGLLIHISRLHIQNFIRIFGLFIFIVGIMSVFLFNNYIQELVIIFLGFGHVLVGSLLYSNKNK